MKINFVKLAFSVGLCLGVGFLGSFFTTSAIPTWYQSLNKPSFSPPNFVFGPVWTILYVLMGISLYLVLSQKKTKSKTLGLNFFWLQLLLNFVWSILFFGMRNPRLSFIEILVLWASIFLTIKYFSNISKLAGKLLVPYLLWVSFASMLNLAIVILN